MGGPFDMDLDFPPIDDDFSPEDVFKVFPTAHFPDPNPVVLESEPTTTEFSITEPPTIGTTVYNISFGPEETWIFGEDEDRIILPLLLSIIGLCALFGNLLVVIVTIVFRRLRTGPNLMLMNIAFSDLVFTLFTLPTSIVNHASLGGVTDSPGVGICKFVHYVIFVCVYVTIYTLVVTCVFRFCTECTGSRGPGALLSRGNALVSCFVIWMAFILSHLNFLIQKDGTIFQEPFICVHTLSIAEPTKMRTLWMTFLTCAFLLPLITVCILSACTLQSQKSNHKFHRNGAYESAQNDANERRNKREISMVIMASMVVRVVCWLPIQIFVMIDIFGVTDISEIYRKAEMLGVCIAFMGCAVNPLIYNCISRNFKQSFREALSCCCRNPHQPPKPNSDASGSDMNETILSIISDSSNHINYVN